MSMDGTPPRGTWAGTAVLLTTVLWLVGVAICLYSIFGNGLAAWGAQGDVARVEELQRAGARDTLWLAAVTVGGPVLAAAFALIGRRAKTAVVYLVLTALLVPPAALMVRDANRTLHPVVISPREPSGACQEHSGGDTRCPGG